MPLAIAAATAYALTCAVAVAQLGEVAASMTRSVLPYEQARTVVVVGLAVGAGMLGEPVLRGLRRTLARHLG